LTKSGVVGLMPKVELTPVFSPADCANAGTADRTHPTAINPLPNLANFEDGIICPPLNKPQPYLHMNFSAGAEFPKSKASGASIP
jgi:hypothetical protein